MQYIWQVSSLLEHTVGHVDPLHLVNRVPAGMSIPRSVLALQLCFTYYTCALSHLVGIKDGQNTFLLYLSLLSIF